MSSRNWIRGLEIEPSIYAADFMRLGEQVKDLLAAGARIFHVDVGDGHFIPPVTIGPIVVQALARTVHEHGGSVDCHLMVSDPAGQIPLIAQAGGDSVTFHVEACPQPGPVIAGARAQGLGVGIAVNPETPLARAVDVAGEADLVLCMSVHPGFSGQTFLPGSLQRIRRLRSMLPEETLIQVDGGLHRGNVGAVRAAGADLLVVGSGVFKHEDVGRAYRELAAAAGRGPPRAGLAFRLRSDR
ncbi:MAG: ribulose-phosphate 3-epimerase [Gaiellaceae bacterium]